MRVNSLSFVRRFVIALILFLSANQRAVFAKWFWQRSEEENKQVEAEVQYDEIEKMQQDEKNQQTRKDRQIEGKHFWERTNAEIEEDKLKELE